ncbi:hypothetical protein [Novosphingobium sp. PC22D]|uniref:hypothetical protein n=1 Tax=Novosphingobium sp. PC22D TaxID=1962403 RepID=UPI0011458D10|nr:hypothetical protein [Novosphingobium sp. PC22D]
MPDADEKSPRRQTTELAAKAWSKSEDEQIGRRRRRTPKRNVDARACSIPRSAGQTSRIDANREIGGLHLPRPVRQHGPLAEGRPSVDPNAFVALLVAHTGGTVYRPKV